jgi:hypothetical protein
MQWNFQELKKYSDYQLKDTMSYDDMIHRLYPVTPVMVEDITKTDGSMIKKEIIGPLYTWDIVAFYLKEQRFLDKKGKVIDKQVIAICPIHEKMKDESYDKIKSVWLKFEDFATVLQNTYITKLQEVSDKTYYDFFHNQSHSTHLIMTLNPNDSE